MRKLALGLALVVVAGGLIFLLTTSTKPARHPSLVIQSTRSGDGYVEVTVLAPRNNFYSAVLHKNLIAGAPDSAGRTVSTADFKVGSSDGCHTSVCTFTFRLRVQDTPPGAYGAAVKETYIPKKGDVLFLTITSDTTNTPVATTHIVY